MNTSEQSLLKAMASQIPPCDKFSCEFKQICSDKKMACRAFDSFINSGRTNFDIFLNFPLPSKTIYNRIFLGEQND